MAFASLPLGEAVSWPPIGPKTMILVLAAGSCLPGIVSIWPALISVYNPEMEVSSYTGKRGLEPALPHNLG